MMHPQEPLLLAIGAIILGLVLAWAVMRYRQRNRANDIVGDIAAREQYRNPEGYNPETFRSQLGPKHR
jgi:hypothetical protein